MLLKNLRYFIVLQIIIFMVLLIYVIKIFNVISWYNRDFFGNIVVIADFSKSMGNSNIIGKYGREVSKLNLEKLLINSLISKDAKRGLIVFADKGYYEIPPTNDIQTYYTILSGLDWKQFSQGSNWFDGLEKFVNYSIAGDRGIFISDFNFDIDSKKVKGLKKRLIFKRNSVVFLSLGNRCDEYIRILGKCFVINNYNDFLKIKKEILGVRGDNNNTLDKIKRYPFWLIPFIIF